MRNESHTNISVIKYQFEAWRKVNAFSRETAVQMVVETHERLGFDIDSGIRFDPNTRDTFERMKVNADRVYRWLDDVTTDKNLLPTNFITSIIATLPTEYGTPCLNEMFRKIGYEVRPINQINVENLNVNHHLCLILKEGSEAFQSVAELSNSTDSHSLVKAEKELSEAIESMSNFKRLVTSAITRAKSAFGVRKEKPEISSN